MTELKLVVLLYCIACLVFVSFDSMKKAFVEHEKQIAIQSDKAEAEKARLTKQSVMTENEK